MTTQKPIRFALAKQTKNTYVFQELDDQGRPLEQREGTIGTLYIKQRAFESRPDNGIIVNVETL